MALISCISGIVLCRKKKEAELLSLDLEIERTLTRLRKLKITEQEGMVEQEDMGDNTQE